MMSNATLHTIGALVAETSIPAMVSLFFFLGLFLAILLWVILGNRNGRFTRDARIPLEDEPVESFSPTTAKARE